MNLPIEKLQPIDINLLQKNEVHQKRRERLFPVLMLLITLAGGGITAWLWVDARSELSDAKKEFGVINKQIEAVQTKLADSANTASLSEFLPLSDQIRNARPYSSDILDKLAVLVPEDSNLGTVSFDGDRAVKITGLFSTTEAVISFMQALKSDPAFTFVGMSGITKVQPEKKEAANGTETPLAAVQASFDLKYNGNLPQKKG
ncbi:MAG: hypothetical protein K0Q90_3245 [Paenibacillaceae bacterium]|jgi:Tfp pilus assembly protein PilN|nr:hypothetical protein [Paenibacillaceae bacterium]